MSYELHYAPGTASLAVHWMLIELGVPFATVRVDLERGDQRSDAYLKLNPQGRVPTLVIDGRPRRESAALLMILAERHPEAGLAPGASDRARERWLEMMIFLANTLLPAMRDWFYAAKDGDPSDADAVRRLALRRIEGAWERLDAALVHGEAHLLGPALSTVDFLAAMLMRWSRNMPRPATDWPRIGEYAHGIRQRPSLIEVCRREGLPLWPPQELR